MSARADLATAARAAILGMVVRRPAAVQPEEGTYTVVDDGTAARYGNRRTPARFKEGRWVRLGGSDLPFEPTFWLAFKE